jgi:GntR family transcriptional repressor for pyruvate dehydrogenase complex
MKANLQAMNEPDIDRETFDQFDTDFHVALADAGGNRLMSDVTRAIRESVRMPILAAMTAMAETGKHGWPGVRDGLRADHRAIYTAVEAGQAEQAADRMESHIRGFSVHMTSATI